MFMPIALVLGGELKKKLSIILNPLVSSIQGRSNHGTDCKFSVYTMHLTSLIYYNDLFIIINPHLVASAVVSFVMQKVDKNNNKLTKTIISCEPFPIFD